MTTNTSRCPKIVVKVENQRVAKLPKSSSLLFLYYYFPDKSKVLQQSLNVRSLDDQHVIGVVFQALENQLLNEHHKAIKGMHFLCVSFLSKALVYLL